MSELAISSSNWLAISLRNGAAVVFNLNNTEQWQCLKPDVPDVKPKTDEDGSDLNRNLIKFTPDGQRLAVNGQNKQIYIYIMSDDKEAPWQLQRTVTVIKRASALDLTDDLLLIADKSGDVYRTDLSGTENVVLTADDCIMGHLSMLLDIAFVRTPENQPFILTADRDEKIRLSHYPNAYNIEGYCLGHDEFVSHVKLIDANRILSASGDGTLRLWHLPDCAQLDLFDAKTLTSSAKQVSFGEPTTSDENDASPIAHSIWKLDVLSGADVLIALSTYTHRNHSIYLTTLANLQKPNSEVRRLTFDSKYGAIVDYCFASNNSTDLHVLFDSDTLVKVNTNDQSLSTVLVKKDFHSMSNVNSLEVIFKQLFKTRGEPGDCSYYKRKNQRLEEQEEKRRKKQQLTSNENV